METSSKRCKLTVIGLAILTVVFQFKINIIAAEDTGGKFEDELNAVVITATMLPRALQEVPGTLSVVNSRLIESLPAAKKINDILSLTPGLALTNYGGLGAVSQPAIRGTLTTQNLVLIDGRMANSLSLGTANLAEIPVDNISRIEILRGPASALYGANSIGGVINVITQEPSDNMKLGVTTELGEWNTQMYRLHVSNTLDAIGLGYFLSANYTGTAGIRPNSDYYGADINGKYVYKTRNLPLKIDFSFGYHQDLLGAPGPQPSTTTVLRTLTQKTFGNDLVSALYDRQKDVKEHVDLTGLVAMDTGHEFVAKLYWETAMLEYLRKYAFYDFISFLPNNYESTDITNTDIAGLNLQYNMFIIKNHRPVIGATVRNEKYAVNQKTLNLTTVSTTNVEQNSNATSIAAYVEDEIQIFDPFSTTIGFRWDSNTGYGQQVNPRVAFLYKLANYNFRASAGRAYRAPTFNDLYYPEDAGARSNPNLKPESSVGGDFGVEAIFNTVIARLNLFRNEVTDMIVWAPTGPMGAYGPKYQPSNINALVSQGVEAEIKAELFDILELSLSYTYTDATQTNREIVNSITNEMVAITRCAGDTPMNKFNAGVTATTPMGLTVTLNSRYTGDRVRYYIKYAAFPDPAVVMDTKHLDGYVTADLIMTQKLFNKLELYLTVNNLVDAKYKEQLGSDINDADYPLPGRMAMFGIKYVF
ncbi:MAG: TonB-dependent receptor [Elusimicrobiota bacterium]